MATTTPHDAEVGAASANAARQAAFRETAGQHAGQLAADKYAHVPVERRWADVESMIKWGGIAGAVFGAGRLVTAVLAFLGNELSIADPTIESASFELTPHSDPTVAVASMVGAGCFAIVGLTAAISATRNTAKWPLVYLASVLSLFALVITVVSMILAAVGFSDLSASDGAWDCRAASADAIETGCVHNPATSEGAGEFPCLVSATATDLGVAADSCLCERGVLWPTDDELASQSRFHVEDIGATLCPEGSEVFTGLTICRTESCSQGEGGQTCSCDDTTTDGSQTRCYTTDLLSHPGPCAGTADDTLAAGRTGTLVDMIVAAMVLYPLCWLHAACALRFVKVGNKPTALGGMAGLLALPQIVACLPAFAIVLLTFPLAFIVAFIVSVPLGKTAYLMEYGAGYWYALFSWGFTNSMSAEGTPPTQAPAADGGAAPEADYSGPVAG